MSSSPINLSADQIAPFKNQTILVVGDLMLDEYHWCKVSRISPEAPVPVCLVEKTTLVPGGCGNVATNIQTLQARCDLLSVIGDDSAGQKLCKVLSELNLNTQGLVVDANRPTVLKSRIVAHKQHVARVDRELHTPIDAPIIEQLWKQFQARLPEANLVVISDYMKGTLPTILINKIIQACQTANIKTIVDPKGEDYGKYQGAYLLTPNFSEFRSCVKKPLQSEDDILREGCALMDQLKLSALVITRSEKGVSVITPERKKIDIPTQSKDVYDITGAGDTVIATLAVGLAADLDLLEAVSIANIAAGIVVGKVGTTPVYWNELEERLGHRQSESTLERI